jgi:acyl-CoA thioesterase
VELDLMAGKSTKQAKQFKAAARRGLRGSQAIQLLGFSLDAIDVGRATLRLGPRHTQLNGVVHGGILAALADTAGAMAAHTVIPQRTALATIELKINYLEPVPGGRVRAEARVLRAGRNFVVAECEIFDARGKLAAKALLTFGAAGGHSFEDG